LSEAAQQITDKISVSEEIKIKRINNENLQLKTKTALDLS
jgi:hypothetical protein